MLHISPALAGMFFTTSTTWEVHTDTHTHIVNSAFINTGVHVFFQTMGFCERVPKRGIAGSYGNYILDF